jgi:YebC/PmpR family DNA-binding regulatory protein
MSGHSHWAGIKHKKAITDKKRAQEFAKASRLLMIAARQGKDPETNYALRTAIDKARVLNMPKDNIERAIKKGAGEVGGAQLEEFLIEAYGPSGIALIISVITDSRNRTLAEVRHILAQHQGKFADGGGVQWLFERTAALTFAFSEETSRDDFELAVIDAGAQETVWEGNILYAYCAPEIVDTLRTVLVRRNVVAQEMEYIFKAKTDISIETSAQLSIQKLLEELDNHDDVQAVYTNAAI